MCWRHVRASRRKGGKRIPTSPGLQVVVRRRCEVGLFLHLRSCRPERTMEKRAYNTRRIISGIELASFHALSLFRLASLSLSHLLLFSTALTLLSKFHFLFSSIIIFIFLPTRIRVIKICLRIDHWDNWNICCIRFCGCLFS